MNDPAAAITGVTVDQVAVTTTTGTGVGLSDVGGSLTFTGLTTNGGTGASLTGTNGSATTFSFSGVAISSATNSGFLATGGGRVTVTGASNTLTSTTGTALTVTDTTIDTSGLTFRSISANGGTNGIVLRNTGSIGGLTVTGNGGPCTVVTPTCTGGTIQNTTADSLSLTNTARVNLGRMAINSSRANGIFGTGVNGFVLETSIMSGQWRANETGRAPLRQRD